MGFVRCLGAAAIVAALVGCGLNATGELPADAAAGVDAPRAERDAEPRDSHVGHPDAHATDAVTQDEDVHANHDAGHDGGHDAGQSGTCPTPPDCSNPACVADGYACVPSPPGWALAAVDFSTDSACPTGYSPSGALVSAPNSDPAVCSCTCAVGTQPSCTTGAITGSYGAGVGSLSCGAGTYSLSGNDGQCTAIGATIEPFVQVASFPPATGGTCVGTPMMSLPSTGSLPVYACTPTGAPMATGCSGGSVCTATTAARSRCVMQTGAPACPTGYGNAHGVGSGVNDGRGCGGACACGSVSATCVNQAWKFYGGGTNTNCTGTGTPLVMDGSCDAQGGAAGSYQSYRFSADPQASCGAPTSNPTPSGSATLEGPASLCCE